MRDRGHPTADDPGGGGDRGGGSGRRTRTATTSSAEDDRGGGRRRRRMATTGPATKTGWRTSAGGGRRPLRASAAEWRRTGGEWTPQTLVLGCREENERGGGDVTESCTRRCAPAQVGAARMLAFGQAKQIRSIPPFKVTESLATEPVLHLLALTRAATVAGIGGGMASDRR
uniref:Uncharacterized protein n=1 Tax=Oryza brachyantha TaxID=4533 RepID=J3MMY5_ORYBR